jgi:RNA polymerase sigma-70 factor, ECF subfamily
MDGSGFVESKDRRALGLELAGMRARLRRFAYGLAGSADEADDLVQAAYERALSRLDQWQAGTRLDSWMFRIIQSIHINRFHARAVRQGTGATSDPDLLMGQDGERDAMARLTLDAVRRQVWRLPEDQRAVLLLVVVEGLSYKEVAETLDVPIGTVTSRLARARMAIRRFLDGRPEADELEPATASQGAS